MKEIFIKLPGGELESNIKTRAMNGELPKICGECDFINCRSRDDHGLISREFTCSIGRYAAARAPLSFPYLGCADFDYEWETKKYVHYVQPGDDCPLVVEEFSKTPVDPEQ